MHKLFLLILSAMFCTLCALSMLSNTHAISLEQPLLDKAQEARAKELFREFRCVVCQGESIHDSHAEIANDLRKTVRLLIKSGHSNDSIKHYMVKRYGDVILIKPPFKIKTLALWVLPYVLLIIGGIFMYRRIGV